MSERMTLEEISDEGALRLVEHILHQASMDYWRARGNRIKAGVTEPSGLETDCERFFRSRWFETLTGLNGKPILEELKSRIDRGDRPPRIYYNSQEEQDDDGTELL